MGSLRSWAGMILLTSTGVQDTIQTRMSSVLSTSWQKLVSLGGPAMDSTFHLERGWPPPPSNWLIAKWLTQPSETAHWLAGDPGSKIMYLETVPGLPMMGQVPHWVEKMHFNVVWMVQFMVKFNSLPVHGTTCDAIAASCIVNFSNKFQHDFDNGHTAHDITSMMWTLAQNMLNSPHRTSLPTITKSPLRCWQWTYCVRTQRCALDGRTSHMTLNQPITMWQYLRTIRPSTNP